MTILSVVFTGRFPLVDGETELLWIAVDDGSLVFIPITPELWNFSKPVDFDRVKGGVAFKLIKTVSVMCELGVVITARVERPWAGDDDNLSDFVILE